MARPEWAVPSSQMVTSYSEERKCEQRLVLPSELENNSESFYMLKISEDIKEIVNGYWILMLLQKMKMSPNQNMIGKLKSDQNMENFPSISEITF